MFEEDIMGNFISFFFSVSNDFYVYQVCEAVSYSQPQTMQIAICVSGMKLSVLKHLQMNLVQNFYGSKYPGYFTVLPEYQDPVLKWGCIHLFY